MSKQYIVGITIDELLDDEHVPQTRLVKFERYASFKTKKEAEDLSGILLKFSSQFIAKRKNGFDKLVI